MSRRGFAFLSSSIAFEVIFDRARKRRRREGTSLSPEENALKALAEVELP